MIKTKKMTPSEIAEEDKKEQMKENPDGTFDNSKDNVPKSAEDSKNDESKVDDSKIAEPQVKEEELLSDVEPVERILELD